MDPRLLRFVGACRAAIEQEIEILIELLDTIDGDPDLEEDSGDMCEAGDDGCGFFKGGMGRVGWGSVWEEQGL